MFDSFRENVSVLIMNTLYGMPSLLHLSSTQSELENSNVHYSGFDIDLSTLASADDQSINHVNPITDPVIEKCSFERNTTQLAPDISFQVHLLSKMNEYRGNDLNMFNQVMRCIKAHAVYYKVDSTTLQILSRKQLVQLLTITRYYQLNFLKPTLHSVPLTDGSIATIPIFDVKAILVAFLNDPLQMWEENFAPNYDIFTGKAKERKQIHGEIHTGSLWEPGRQRYCGDNPNVFPPALVCFYDKTNTDVFGLLSCAPFICTPSFLNKGGVLHANVVKMLPHITPP
jgi:hypothetical protein